MIFYFNVHSRQTIHCKMPQIFLISRQDYRFFHVNKKQREMKSLRSQPNGNSTFGVLKIFVHTSIMSLHTSSGNLLLSVFLGRLCADSRAISLSSLYYPHLANLLVLSIIKECFSFRDTRIIHQNGG